MANKTRVKVVTFDGEYITEADNYDAEAVAKAMQDERQMHIRIGNEIEHRANIKAIRTVKEDE